MPTLSLDWLHLLILLGSIQGVLLTAVLITKRQNQTANRLLGAAIFAFTIFLATGVYYASGLVRAFPYLIGISYPLLFVFGPLIYLYALTASDRSRRLRRADALHFLPFILILIGGLPLYLTTGTEKLAFFDALARGQQPLLLRWTNPLMVASGVGYATATLLLLARHAQRIKDSYSHLERVNLRWLLWLGSSVAAIWLLVFTFQLMQSVASVRVAHADDIVALAVAALVYAIGYMGLRQPEIFQYASLDVLPDEVGPETRYERSGLSDWEAASLKHKLLDVMDTTRPWQNSELTLADLAALLRTTPHKVSEVLNTHIGQTFYDFVNGYRVREVQQRLAREGATAPKLLALAMDAGFASKSTFNDVFKKHTGKTPSAYRNTAARS